MDHRIGEQSVDRRLGTATRLVRWHVPELQLVDARRPDPLDALDPQVRERFLDTLRDGVDDARLQFNANLEPNTSAVRRVPVPRSSDTRWNS